MASHRKPRNRVVIWKHAPSAPGRRATVGLTTAALASVTLLSQGAQPAFAQPDTPDASLTEVKAKVDRLYQQAGTATQQYNAAKQRTDKRRATVNGLLDQVADQAEQVNEARRKLGNYAAAQYRSGSASATATLLFAPDAEGFFDREHLLGKMTDEQHQAVTDYQSQQAATAKKRQRASRSLRALTEAQGELKTKKESVQHKLTAARTLLSKLTEKERARLAELERKKQAEAQRKAAALAKKQAAEAKQREAAEQRQEKNAGGGDDAGEKQDGTSSGQDNGGYASKADKAIAFARSQIGKPYVWGATGPNSYDCSGLTQAAWKSAGVTLPRTTWDQVEVGKRVATDDLLPGDLVFFYDDVSHVGLYIGDGKMIHAPKPGANVREESIFYMPIYGSVRPA